MKNNLSKKKVSMKNKLHNFHVSANRKDYQAAFGSSESGQIGGSVSDRLS